MWKWLYKLNLKGVNIVINKLVGKVKALWNKVQEVIVDFVRGTIEDFYTVWEFRPNVIIWLVVLAVLCLFV